MNNSLQDERNGKILDNQVLNGKLIRVYQFANEWVLINKKVLNTVACIGYERRLYMAKITKEILNQIKMMFDDKEFTVVEGKIYKKIKRSSINVLDNDGITKSVSIRRLIKSIEEGRSYKIDEDVYENFKKSIEQGEYVISNYSWVIFKKYGSIHERGYINFHITINGITYRTFAHRIIYYLTYGIWDEDKVINHKDNNKQNNKPDNLELITQFENILYSIRNNEILIHPSMLDDVCRKKYRLNDCEWELFKSEVIKAYKRNGENASYPLKILKC